MKGLAHLGVYTADISAAKAFYSNNLSFKLTDEASIDTPDGVLKLALLEWGGFVIELMERSKGWAMPVGVGGTVDHICLAVDDIEGLVKTLRSKGVHFETEAISDLPKLFGGIRNIFLTGPDAVRIELMQYIRK
jgi:lactoylglutathione lyase